MHDGRCRQTRVNRTAESTFINPLLFKFVWPKLNLRRSWPVLREGSIKGSAPRSCCPHLATTRPVGWRMPRWVPRCPHPAHEATVRSNSLLSPIALGLRPERRGRGQARPSEGPRAREGAAGSGTQQGWGKAGAGDRAGLERCALGAAPEALGQPQGQGCRLPRVGG